MPLGGGGGSCMKNFFDLPRSCTHKNELTQNFPSLLRLTQWKTSPSWQKKKKKMKSYRRYLQNLSSEATLGKEKIEDHTVFFFFNLSSTGPFPNFKGFLAPKQSKVVKFVKISCAGILKKKTSVNKKEKTFTSRSKTGKKFEQRKTVWMSMSQQSVPVDWFGTEVPCWTCENNTSLIQSGGAQRKERKRVFSFFYSRFWLIEEGIKADNDFFLSE